MRFVTGTEEHTSQIVELLKITLGESLTKKTVEFWDWKHNENPFGKSKMILAFDGEMLVGVRAFMCWQFSNVSETLKCVRAVDTAVHPSYQGKGIFSKLTMAALDDCKNDNIKLVFNTPNKISKIGYLKLGWIEIGKLPLRLLFPFKIPRIYNEKLLRELLANCEIGKINKLNINTNTNKFSTPLNFDYINWRYTNCPIDRYYCITKTDKFLIIFRIKKVKSFVEMRLCEVVINNNEFSINEAVKNIRKVIKIIRPAFVSCVNNDNILSAFFTKLYFFPNLKVGPIVTLKNINYNCFEDFKNYNIWQPTLGCMELF
jgi:GNAT superfamily N-acetyltransferase